MDVVDLGCGWGSLTLYLLGKFPNIRVTSVSNSATQKVHIESGLAMCSVVIVTVRYCSRCREWLERSVNCPHHGRKCTIFARVKL